MQPNKLEQFTTFVNNQLFTLTRITHSPSFSVICASKEASPLKSTPQVIESSAKMVLRHWKYKHMILTSCVATYTWSGEEHIGKTLLSWTVKLFQKYCRKVLSTSNDPLQQGTVWTLLFTLASIQWPFRNNHSKRSIRMHLKFDTNLPTPVWHH